MEKIKLNGKVEIEFAGKNILFIRQHLGEGTLGDRKVDMGMTNAGIVFDVHNGKSDWDTYHLSWDSISKCMSDVVLEHEKNAKESKQEEKQ